MPAHASPDTTAPSAHAAGCWCALHGRRLFGSLLLAGGAAAVAGPAGAQQPPTATADEEGLRRDVGKESRFTKLVSAEQVEAAAGQQYQQMMRQAQQQGALAPPEHPQLVRLRAIAERIIPYAVGWNPRARQWRWEVNLLRSDQVNAFCMPGGKIAFYSAILSKLKLSDDEVAMIMGHEVAHALREHARERIGKSYATNGLLELGSAVLGLGNMGRTVAGLGGQMLSLKFGRDDETEADLVGLDLAARAGYDPASGVSLWQKMMAASQGAPPQFLSTHPAGDTRIRDIQAKLPKVQPLYERAEKPPRRYGPPSA